MKNNMNPTLKDILSLEDMSSLENKYYPDDRMNYLTSAQVQDLKSFILARDQRILNWILGEVEGIQNERRNKS